jgi:mono/diheme cytochrome c family protein
MWKLSDRRHRRGHAIVFLLGVIGLIATHPAAALAGGDTEHGLAVASQWCNSCHVVRQNDPGMDDGEFAPRFSTLTAYDAQSLKQLLAKGHADMDALSKLSDRDVEDIAAYLKRLKPESP